MFEKGLAILRRLAPERLKAPADGLTGGDAALLELLDLKLLNAEGKACDVAAGRIGTRDRAKKRLEAAMVWREVARRAGDAAALRKAAACAEASAAAFHDARRTEGWARARCEQALCALLGAELFGDEGLEAAAEVAFRDAAGHARSGLAAPLAGLGLAVVAARRRLARGSVQDVTEALAAFAQPMAAFEALGRRTALARSFAAEARLIRADLACGFGARLAEPALLAAAVEDAQAVATRLDPAYEPITWARAEGLRGQALTRLGELSADIDQIAAGATALAGALDQLTRDHSPLDWARTQAALGQSLMALGEAADQPRAYEQAVTCFERAGLVLNELTASPLRGLAAAGRALSLARQAELTGDLAVLDVAEAAMKTELARLPASRDPVGWALAQLQLARLYESRMEITGKIDVRRAGALTALEVALEVFADHGLATLAAQAADAMKRLGVAAHASRSR